MSHDEPVGQPSKAKRERSTRYPGVPLAETIDLCKFVESRGLDGLRVEDIATELGYKNIKTNTFSARLSASRQFGLLVLKDGGYSLTTLAKSILHPVDPNEVPRLHRQAFLEPSLYRDLAEQFTDKRVPDSNILGNVLYHNYQIIAAAKQAAAEAFLESARFAGVLGEDHVLRPSGASVSAAAPAPLTPVTTPANLLPTASPSTGIRSDPTSRLESPARNTDVRIDLRLWGADQGKAIRVRAPESITPASLERLLQTLRLHLRVEEPSPEHLDESEDELADADD